MKQISQEKRSRFPSVFEETKQNGIDELNRVGTYLVICVGGGCGDAVAREATVSVERAVRIV